MKTPSQIVNIMLKVSELPRVANHITSYFCCNFLKDYRGFKSIALTACLSLVSGPSYSHPQDTLKWSLEGSGGSGIINTTNGSDTFNIDFLLSSTVPLLVAMPCSSDSPTLGSVSVDNLSDILNGGAAPKYSSKLPGPSWRLCGKDNFIILNGLKSFRAGVRGEVIDAERLISDGAITTSIGASGYRISTDEAKLYASDPGALWKILSTNGRVRYLSHLYIDIHFNMSFSGSPQALSWKTLSFEDLYGGSAQSEGSADNLVWSQPQTLRLSEITGKAAAPIEFNNESASILFNKKTIRNALKSKDILTSASPLKSQGFEEKNNNTLSAHSASSASNERITANGKRIKGKVMVKWGSDNSWHPGLGLKIAAYGKSSAQSEYNQMLGSAMVDSTGSYSIPLSGNTNLSLGVKLIQKTSSNYYRMTNDSNDIYQNWVYKDISGDLVDPSDSRAYRINVYIDKPIWKSGVGQASYYVGNVWQDFVNRLGVDPTFYSRRRPSPINIIFPHVKPVGCNTTIDGIKEPWSCSGEGGKKVWFTQDHGLIWHVVAHELAHSLNFKFWEGRLPAGAGGSHNPWTCYPGVNTPGWGMALTEGFADFISVWHGYPDPQRNYSTFDHTNGRYAGIGYVFNIEGPPILPPSEDAECIDGISTEVAVARTFWDLYDHGYDINDYGYDDSMGFANGERVILEYLYTKIPSNGALRTMSWYLGQYINIGGNSPWVEGVFELNKTSSGPDRVHTIQVGIH